MLHDLKTNKAKVQYILERDTESQNCDKRLWVQVMWTFYGFGKPGTLGDISEFIAWFTQDNIPSVESIRRIRQKLQEKNPEFRGTQYEQRHKEERAIRQWLKTE